MSPPPPTTHRFFQRVFRGLLFRLHGRRAGLGRPVPAEALDNEYASGAWDHFLGPDELERHERLLELMREAHPAPRLLDLGCGSGRLARMIPAGWRSAYLGVDLSAQGLERARAGTPAGMRFERHDFEVWTCETGAFDLIGFNECLGYAADPLRTARRFARTLGPEGSVIVSHFRTGNHVEFWRRLAREFDVVAERVAANAKGQVWDLRTLRLRAAARPAGRNS